MLKRTSLETHDVEVVLSGEVNTHDGIDGEFKSFGCSWLILALWKNESGKMEGGDVQNSEKLSAHNVAASDG